MTAAIHAAWRGRKHRCGACGAAFYDLDRELSVCPKCETPYEAAAHMPRGEIVRKRQAWSKKVRQPEPQTAPEASAEAREDDIEGAPIFDAVDDADEENESTEEPATEDDEAETSGQESA